MQIYFFICFVIFIHVFWFDQSSAAKEKSQSNSCTKGQKEDELTTTAFEVGADVAQHVKENDQGKWIKYEVYKKLKESHENLKESHNNLKESYENLPYILQRKEYMGRCSGALRKVVQHLERTFMTLDYVMKDGLVYSTIQDLITLKSQQFLKDHPLQKILKNHKNDAALWEIKKQFYREWQILYTRERRYQWELFVTWLVKVSEDEWLSDEKKILKRLAHLLKESFAVDTRMKEIFLCCISHGFETGRIDMGRWSNKLEEKRNFLDRVEKIYEEVLDMEITFGRMNVTREENHTVSVPLATGCAQLFKNINFLNDTETTNEPSEDERINAVNEIFIMTNKELGKVPEIATWRKQQN